MGAYPFFKLPIWKNSCTRRQIVCRYARCCAEKYARKGPKLQRAEKKEKHEGQPRKKSLFREYLEAAVIAVLLALFIRAFVVQAFKIPSGSMKPTLLIGDHILVNKFIYGIKVPFTDHYILQIKKPKRGDIVVFKWPRNERKDFIKRIVGVEGDTIEIKGDVLYVNNEEIETTYVGRYSDKELGRAHKYLEFLGETKHYILHVHNKSENFGPKLVPENAILVMGDNRDQSLDSRYWGFVSLNKVKGKAFIIYWSWPHWKRVGHLVR
jgi:signal peptidase I